MSAFHASRFWPALRLAAKRRDGWACVKCGSRVRLEVDHVQPVERRPDLALALDNLQTLCAECHIEKTRREAGAIDPESKRAWSLAISDLLKRRT